jgi:hypothetical protein
MFSFTKLSQTISGGAAAVKDAYFNLVTLLLNTISTNGAQNNTFLDSSTNNFSITRNGNTTQGTFTPFSQTGWSNYQSEVSTNYLSFTTSAGTLFQFTGDYTIETWIYPTSLSVDASVWIENDGSANYFGINVDSTNYNIYLNASGATSSFAHGLSLNQWSHIAMVRSGSTVTVYTNGVSKGTITNSSTNGYASPSIARNGGGGTTGQVRYLSNLRIVKGTAVYTSAFTPPTTALTAISGTSLLTCQSNRFVDNSSNALVATVTGTPSVQAFSPFAPTAAYSTATVGGSAYFDGSGDYLVTPSTASLSSTLLASNFTIECWLYLTTYPSGGGAIWTNSTSNSDGFSSAYVTSAGIVELGKVGVNGFSSTATVVINSWNHFATVRSGSTVYLYLNGVQVASGAAATYLNTSSAKPLQIGQNNQSSPVGLTGYISGYRVVSSALYTGSTYTIPTSVPTAITGTQLLLNLTNSGIFDSTAKNVLETVGNAQVSTTQVKWGTTSMAFDGTGDWLFLNSSAASANTLALGSGDFTVEMWLYPNSSYSGSFAGIMDSRTTGDGAGLVYFGYTSTANQIGWKDNATNVVTGTVTQSAWNHVAVVRASGTLKLYINGSLASSGANSTNYTVPFKYIGSSFDPLSFNGYIDDLRITRGYARYSGSTYTQPTTAFPLQ